MKKFIRILGVLLIVSTVFFGCSSTIEDEELSQELEGDNEIEVNQSDYVEGEILVALEKPSGFSVANTEDVMANQILALENNNFEVLNFLLDFDEEQEIEAEVIDSSFKAEVIDKLGFVYLVEYSDEFGSIVEAMDKLEEDLIAQGKEVKYIEPNYKFSLQQESQINPKLHPKQEWNYEMINAPQAWDLIEGSKEVKLSIVDTGIDDEHINLSNFVDSSLSARFSTSVLDRTGHGTHVAGIAASYGDISGVMKEATHIDVKVLCPYTQSTTETITRGIIYSANVETDVINLSLGGRSYSEIMEEATEVAYNNNSILVAAAGNEGQDSISYPARYEHVISVGAVDENRERANFSNTGDNLDFMAPGVNVYSARPEDSYDLSTGTSMSTPHVTGLIGLMRAVKEDITLEEVKEILADTAQEAGNSQEYGYGIIDSYQAVLEVGDFDDYRSNYDDVYLRGTLNDWKTTEMKLVTDYTWEAEVSFDGEENDRFKFDIYGDWSLNYGDDNGDSYANQNGADIFVDQAGEYTITFNDKTKKYDVELRSGNGYDSNYDNVYLRGTLNDWDTTAMDLVADNIWEAKVSFDGEENDRFKFDIYGDWSLNYGDNNGDGYAEQDGADIFVEQAGEYTITFNDKTKEYNVELRSGNGYDSNYDNVYLRGTLNDWDTTAMELVADNIWEAKVSFDGEENERFKFDIYGDWNLNYGDNNGDGYAEQDGADIPISQAGEYIITFNDETKEYSIR